MMDEWREVAKQMSCAVAASYGRLDVEIDREVLKRWRCALVQAVAELEERANER